MEKSFQIDAHAAGVLSVILDTIDALVVILNDEGTIIFFNGACERLTGFKAAEVLGKPVWTLLVPEEAAAVRSVFEGLREGETRSRFENYWVSRDGRRHRIAWSNASVRAADGSRRIIGTGIDVTARRRTEAELRRSRKELRNLTAQLLERQERKNRDLARELHDGFSQQLAALGIELARTRSGDADAVPQLLEKTHRTIQMLGRNIHELSGQLHPSIVEDLGIKAALRSECRNFSERYGVPLHCKMDDLPAELPVEMSLNLYRILQESLDNIEKHAGASSVHVDLGATGDGIELSIRDEGVGFDFGKERFRGGLGLVGMKERARSIGAMLSVTSSPGIGTTIRVRLPLAPEIKGMR